MDPEQHPYHRSAQHDLDLVQSLATQLRHY